MTVAPRVSIEEVSAIFAEALRDVAVAREAWVSSTYDAYDLWLLVEPIDLAAERELYAVVDRLYEHFPLIGFSLYILNPETFVDLAPETIVPARAHHVALRASA